ncbi:MAG: multidrug MFS transporter [Flavobacteriales bacterium]|nr:MAG: multidrug MFS transporter [Flavobacteriales bacterium]
MLNATYSCLCVSTHKFKVKLKKRKYTIIFGLILGYFILNSIRIYQYSFVYFENKSDVAIVLGAGTNEGKLSPVFKERINHSLLLYKKGLIDKIIFTGGFGKGQTESDSQIAKNYALKNGVPEYNIIIEDKSQFTIENISESKLIMDSIGVKTALIISDPLHMKRAIKLAEFYGIDCTPSPTKTTMYKSTYPKTKLLLYETFYFSLREPISLF